MARNWSARNAERVLTFAPSERSPAELIATRRALGNSLTPERFATTAATAARQLFPFGITKSFARIAVTTRELTASSFAPRAGLDGISSTTGNASPRRGFVETGERKKEIGRASCRERV